MRGLLDHRLLFVTGKGGVGKTTVASALGILVSELGKRTLVCEMEARGDLSGTFECGPVSYSPRQIAPGLEVMAMDTEAALGEYLQLHLHIHRSLPPVGRMTPVAQALDFVATAAPGVREILTIGKLCYEVRENHYDLVIVDSSASGHIVGNLAAPVAINDLVRVGAVHSETAWMLDMLSDADRTGVLIVTTPEEMPVNEAIELCGRLRQETGVGLAGLVANRVLPELFGRAEEEDFAALSSPEHLASFAAALGVDASSLHALLSATSLAVQIRRGGAAHLDRLREAVGGDVPLLNLPYLFGRAHGPRAVRQIASQLAEELSLG